MKVGLPARRHDQTVTRRARKGCKKALDLASVAHVSRGHLYPESRRHSLDDTEQRVAGSTGRIPKNCNSGYTWRDLLEQLQPFPSHGVFETHEPGGVTARLPQTIAEAIPNGIAGDRENDRHRACHL